MPDDAKLTHRYLVRISEKVKWNGVLKTNQNTLKKKKVWFIQVNLDCNLRMKLKEAFTC